MIAHNLNKYPEGLTYTYGDIDNLCDFDIKKLQAAGIDEAWYWYSFADYEGSGQILMRKGSLYDLHDAGHCSCYGPTDDISLNLKTLDSLKISLSGDSMKEVKELFEMAEATHS